MKLLVYGLCFLLMTAAFCTVNFLYIRHSLEEAAGMLDDLEIDVAAESWDTAAEKSAALIENWRSKENYYMAVLWHQHIDDIAVSLHQLQNDINLRDAEEANNSIIGARTVIRDIVEMESLSLGNIF